MTRSIARVCTGSWLLWRQMFEEETRFGLKDDIEAVRGLPDVTLMTPNITPRRTHPAFHRVLFSANNQGSGEFLNFRPHGSQRWSKEMALKVRLLLYTKLNVCYLGHTWCEEWTRGHKSKDLFWKWDLHQELLEILQTRGPGLRSCALNASQLIFVLWNVTLVTVSPRARTLQAAASLIIPFSSTIQGWSHHQINNRDVWENK